MLVRRFSLSAYVGCFSTDTIQTVCNPQCHVVTFSRWSSMKVNAVRLGNVTILLDVTPSNLLLHHYHLHPCHFVFLKSKNLAAKQLPTLESPSAYVLISRGTLIKNCIEC